MARDPAEAEALRAQTVEFIETDGDDITLTRQGWVSDDAGGRIPGPRVNVPSQKFKFQPTSALRQPERTSPSGGGVVRPEFQLLGLWDADVEAGDEFTWQGGHYEVVFVDRSLEYRTMAEVVKGGAS